MPDRQSAKRSAIERELQLRRDPACPACGSGDLAAATASDGVFALPDTSASMTGVNA